MYEVSCVKDVMELPYGTTTATRSAPLDNDDYAQPVFPTGSTRV
jgi:hypothetical protein